MVLKQGDRQKLRTVIAEDDDVLRRQRNRRAAEKRDAHAAKDALEAGDVAIDTRLDALETALPLKLQWATVPASAAAAGTAGQLAYATGFIYVCVATNTWERAAIATWV